MRDGIRSGILMLVLFVACSILGYAVYEFISIKNMVTSGEGLTFNINGHSILDTQYYGEITDLQILAKRFANNHDYNVSGYNCVNYSIDFKVIADALGFDVEIEEACVMPLGTPNNSCHAYNVVRLPLEPQSGEFKDMSFEYPYKKK